MTMVKYGMVIGAYPDTNFDLQQNIRAEEEQDTLRINSLNSRNLPSGDLDVQESIEYGDIDDCFGYLKDLGKRNHDSSSDEILNESKGKPIKKTPQGAGMVMRGRKRKIPQTVSPNPGKTGKKSQNTVVDPNNSKEGNWRSQHHESIAHNRTNILKVQLRSMILYDKLDQQECLTELTDYDREILIHLIKSRYQGADNNKMPFKSKVISPFNNKLKYRISNEKKFLPELWRMMMEEVRKMRQINTEGFRCTIDLFRTYHVENSLSFIHKKNVQLKGSNKEEELNYLINTFAAGCIDLPNNITFTKPINIYAPIVCTDLYIKGMMENQNFYKDCMEVLKGDKIIQTHISNVDSLISKVLTFKKERKKAIYDNHENISTLNKLGGESYNLEMMQELKEKLLNKIQSLVE